MNSGSVKNEPRDPPNVWKFRKCPAEMYVSPACGSKTMGLLEELLRLVLFFFLKALLCSVGTCALLIKNVCFNHIAGGVELWILRPTESNVRADVFFNKHEEIFFFGGGRRVEGTKRRNPSFYAENADCVGSRHICVVNILAERDLILHHSALS